MSETKPKLELVRGLGGWASAAIVVGTMIGTGIFLKPAEMATLGGSIGIVYVAWIVGAVLSLFGALAYAELGAAIPEAGGEYAYLRICLARRIILILSFPGRSRWPFW
jgi:basic amino acid/polyamine antiporter, APA family